MPATQIQWDSPPATAPAAAPQTPIAWDTPAAAPAPAAPVMVSATSPQQNAMALGTAQSTPVSTPNLAPPVYDMYPGGRLVAIVGGRDRYNVLDAAQAQPLWNEAVGRVPKYESEPVSMITGAVLPIWDRLGGTPKVYRLQTDAGGPHHPIARVFFLVEYLNRFYSEERGPGTTLELFYDELHAAYVATACDPNLTDAQRKDIAWQKVMDVWSVPPIAPPPPLQSPQGQDDPVVLPAPPLSVAMDVPEPADAVYRADMTGDRRWGMTALMLSTHLGWSNPDWTRDDVFKETARLMPLMPTRRAGSHG